MPTSQKLWEDDSAYNFLSWSYCWDSPWISKANGSVLNKTSVEQYRLRQTFLLTLSPFDQETYLVEQASPTTYSGDQGIAVLRPLRLRDFL